MAEGNDLERLRALEDRITKARTALEPPPAPKDHHSMAQTGWRMVIELVSGLGIGAALGYGLDVLFGTLPLFLVLLTLLGFAAGVQTMLRTAREFSETSDDTAPSRTGAEQRDEDRGR